MRWFNTSSGWKTLRVKDRRDYWRSTRTSASKSWMKGQRTIVQLQLMLQSDLDQEYQDKFRRLPVEIQEFVQDSSKAKLSDDSSGNLVSSSTTEKLNHKASQSEDDTEEGSSERVYDTPL
ncbi:1-phosphatidylinositol 4,5-bisphosphate phosphodiesterase beta-1-like [Stegastes partitus]|uniref:1-phosphatidylinositol 4,5-bisphosphate phosphodiesterase beta-1-like n=1 Tax=Stegastes partitus TaxID=144197 RepID=A0A9Y4NJT1_9TELE|nr:PREDICTED: 1-phosphatidylinositol 4,5-bisphosphate phosphodiesterase beta-1-like [Stegastes partitus]